MKENEIPPMSKGLCRSCNAPIIWTITAAGGKPAPVDMQPGGYGDTVANLKLTIQDGRVYSKVLRADLAFGNKSLHLSHFVRCPESKQWRNPNPHKSKSRSRSRR